MFSPDRNLMFDIIILLPIMALLISVTKIVPEQVKDLLRDENIFSRGTTLIAACLKPPLKPGSNNPCPCNGGYPYALTWSFVQSVSSGVYLYIRQHLLAPTAGSLNAGFHAGHAG